MAEQALFPRFLSPRPKLELAARYLHWEPKEPTVRLLARYCRLWLSEIAVIYKNTATLSERCRNARR